MNLLLWFSLLVASLSWPTTFGEQLYHREGRFIDLSLHRYKTQLPSIHDIASTFIHYRMPVAVFIPTVRLNLRSKQKRIHYSSFPAASVSSSKKVGQPVQEAPPSKPTEQETQAKSNKDPTPSSNLISRSGWTPQARSLSKPRSYYALSNHKLARISEQTRRRNSLNYASSGESNADLIPFLYKDNLAGQPSLFNSAYQLTNSNVFGQNIAYIPPNSVSPFQPANILLIPASPVNEQLTVSNSSSPVAGNSTAVQQSVSGEQPANQSASQPAIQPAIQPLSNSPAEAQRPASETILASNSSDSATAQFDISQVGENPDEIAQEHVQSHEPLDAVPVNSVEEPSSVARSNLSEPNSLVDSTANVSDAASNATAPIISPISPVLLIDESRQLEPIENARLTAIPYSIPYAYGSNALIRRLAPNPVYEPKSMRIPKNLITGRAHRSLPIDMPSMAGLYTSAAAQAGHTSENRRQLFAKFLDENYN